MEWQFVNKDHKIVDTPTDMQIDIVGNIVQRSGAVVPKACQSCKTVFQGDYEIIPIKQPIPIYSCKQCEQKFNTGDKAFDHMLTEGHQLSKSTEERVVSYNKILIGEFPHITKSEDDVRIVCSKCIGSS